MGTKLKCPSCGKLTEVAWDERFLRCGCPNPGAGNGK